MEDVRDEHDEAAEQPADFVEDLDQLAVVEAELADAEAELEALEEHAGEPDSEPAS